MKKQIRSQPKRVQAIQTSRHFRVSAHRHSGHVLPRTHTSYPVLFMIVLCVGVLLASWTRFVTADSFVYPGPGQDKYVVHGSVPGPPPTVGATIDSPADGDVFTDLPVTVSGSCSNNTYVSVSRNDVFSGVGICQANNTYSVTTGLFDGVNQLKAQVYSYTDVPGPASNIVMVTYKPPKPVTPTNPNPTATDSQATTVVGDSSVKKPAGSTKKQPTSTPASSSPGAPLLLKSVFKYQGVYTGSATDWQLAIEGGTGPYAISIDWGDGTHSVVSRSNAGAFVLEHTYKKAGAYKGSYTATFTVSDATGTQTYLQLITVVNDQPKGVARTDTGDRGGFVFDTSPDYLRKLLAWFWPGYGVVLLMLTSFWLGERREYKYLKPRIKKSKQRHA